MVVEQGSFWKGGPQAFDELIHVESVSEDFVTVQGRQIPRETFLLMYQPVSDNEVGSFFRVVQGKIERGTEHSVGFDVFFTGESSYWDRKAKAFVPNPVGDIWVGDRAILLKTSVRTEMSPDLAAIMKEKSGLSTQGLELKAGVIDADYREEWGVVARFPMTFEHHFNPAENKFLTYRDTDWQPFEVKVGMKIAQFIIIRKVETKLVFGPKGEIVTKNAKRTGGFGSTGV
jgi:dUTPase